MIRSTRSYLIEIKRASDDAGLIHRNSWFRQLCYEVLSASALPKAGAIGGVDLEKNAFGVSRVILRTA